MPLQPNQLVGPYVLLRQLGRGAFGEVWLARHFDLDELRALKIPHDPQCIRQLQREGRIIHDLQHENIVRGYDVNSLGDPPYVAMEYVEGVSLRQKLKAVGKLPPPEALATLRQILAALAYAHGHGVIHRDLKPENVMLTADGAVKVTDFGLGMVQADLAQSILLSGSLMSGQGQAVAGTIDYMSPQQRAGEAPDVRDDIYAVGVIACELLTGSRPMPVGIAKMLARAGLDGRFDELLERSLEWERPARFAGAEEMLAAMERIGAGEEKADGTPRADAFIKGPVEPVPPVSSPADVAARQGGPAAQGAGGAAPPPHKMPGLVARLQAAANLQDFLTEVVGAMAVMVGGTEAAGFALQRDSANPSRAGLRPLVHIRPDQSDATTRAAAIAAFQELLVPCVQQDKDAALEVGSPDGGDPQFCLARLLRREGTTVAVAAVIVRCRNQAEARQRLTSLQLNRYFDMYVEREAAQQRESDGTGGASAPRPAGESAPFAPLPPGGGAPANPPLELPEVPALIEPVPRASVPPGRLPPLANSMGMLFVGIPPGQFVMGSRADEMGRQESETPHRVSIRKAFLLGAYPITRDQFAEFVAATGYTTGAEMTGWSWGWGEDGWERVTGACWRAPGLSQEVVDPVVCVSWRDARAFARWLSERESRNYRLPTEAEWEYACRAGMTTPFHFGRTISTDQANYDGSCYYGPGRLGVFRRTTTPVGSFSANAWDLWDMHGNIWEWCADWYAPYADADAIDPTGPASGRWRVLRGGSWSDNPANCRSASRWGARPEFGSACFGFRLALDPVAGAADAGFRPDAGTAAASAEAPSDTGSRPALADAETAVARV